MGICKSSSKKHNLKELDTKEFDSEEKYLLIKQCLWYQKIRSTCSSKNEIIK